MSYDTVEVSIETGLILAFMCQNKSKKNAEAIEEMAIMRIGVEESFFSVVEHGKFKIGDTYAR